MHHGAPYVFAAYRARKSSVGEEWNATGGSAVPAIRRIYDPSGHRKVKSTASLRSGKGSAPLLGFQRRELPAHRPARASSVHCNHDVGGLHHDGHFICGLDAEFIDRLIRDRGGDDLPIADIDADMRGGRALLDFNDGAFDLVACTDAHGGSHNVRPCAAVPRTC